MTWRCWRSSWDRGLWGGSTYGWLGLLRILRAGLFCIGLLPAPLAAQEDGLPTSSAAEELEQADRALQAGSLAQARVLYSRAHHQQPSAYALRGLGLVEFELRKYPASLLRLQEALDCKQRPLDPETRRMTEATVRRIRAVVGEYILDIRPWPAGVVIWVDGMDAELHDATHLLLSRGEHMVQVRAPGFREGRQMLRVQGGEIDPLVFELHSSSHPVVALGVQASAAVRPLTAEPGQRWAQGARDSGHIPAAPPLQAAPRLQLRYLVGVRGRVSLRRKVFDLEPSSWVEGAVEVPVHPFVTLVPLLRAGFWIDEGAAAAGVGRNQLIDLGAQARLRWPVRWFRAPWEPYVGLGAGLSWSITDAAVGLRSGPGWHASGALGVQVFVWRRLGVQLECGYLFHQSWQSRLAGQPDEQSLTMRLHHLTLALGLSWAF